MQQEHQGDQKSNGNNIKKIQNPTATTTTVATTTSRRSKIRRQQQQQQLQQEHQENQNSVNLFDELLSDFVLFRKDRGLIVSSCLQQKKPLGLQEA